jgi:hypothetical protein
MPRWVSTNGRAVTEQDFDTLGERFSDVVYGSFAYVKAKLRQEIPELNTVDIYTWARDAAGTIVTPSAGLKNALQEYFMNNGEGSVRLICTDVEVQDGNVVYVDVDATLTISDLYAATTVSGAVEDELDEYFSSPSNRPGTPVRLSHLYDRIQDTTGVEHALVNTITASYLTTETMATGDGVTVAYNFTLTLDSNLPVVPNTVEVTVDDMVAQDDGDGNLLIGAATVGTVDYDTGAVAITFPAAPNNGSSINVEYRHIIDYQRGELDMVADGTAQIQGAVDYPPVVPYDTVTGEKGIAITDGHQVVRDALGDGVLYDENNVNRGTVDYDTGAYNFQFGVVPAAGSEIRSTYRQMLQTPSEDLPITKTQVATKGLYTINTVTV